MEKYNLRPVSINQVGEADQHGNLAYSIVFENNQSGFFKCKTQDLFVVNEPAEFYIEKAVGRSGKEYNKIRRVSSVENAFENNQKKSSTGEPGKSKDNIMQINRSVAVKAICELRAQSSVGVADIIREADILFDYINFGVLDKDEPKDGHKEALKQQEPIEENELPF